MKKQASCQRRGWEMTKTLTKWKLIRLFLVSLIVLLILKESCEIKGVEFVCMALILILERLTQRLEQISGCV